VLGGQSKSEQLDSKTREGWSKEPVFAILSFVKQITRHRVDDFTKNSSIEISKMNYEIIE
jgi:hypothetical protein